MYTCKTCGITLENIPADAVRLSERRRVFLYRFADGTVHDLRQSFKHTLDRARHVKYHTNKNILKAGCEFCYPQPQGQ